eukprot:jgi/Mesvir1/2465/Mv09995-RA.3
MTWRWIFRLALDDVARNEGGFTVFLILFCVAVASVVITIPGCLWMVFYMRSSTHGLSRLTRAAALFVQFMFGVFFKLLFVPLLSILLTPVDCEKAVVDGLHTRAVKAFPDHACSGTGGMLLAVLGAAFGLLLIVLVVLYEITRVVFDPMSKDITAFINHRPILFATLFKALLVINFHFASNMPIIAGAIATFLAALLLFFHDRGVPYYSRALNKAVGGLYMGLFWMCLSAFIIALTKNDASEVMTKLFFALWPVFFLLGYFLIRMRLRWAYRVATRFLGRGLSLATEDGREVFEFSNPNVAEVVSRFARVQLKKIKRQWVPDADNLTASELVLLQGVAAFPESALAHIHYSNFLLYMRMDPAKSKVHLEKAKAMTTIPLFLKYLLFVREKETRLDTTRAMDMASYMEFMRHFRMALYTHKACLKETRNFWRSLLKNEITFEAMATSFKTIQEAEITAERTYRSVLEIYPKNSRLLRSYAKFLEGVKNDITHAARYSAEAERQEEAEQEANESAGLGAGQDENDSVIVISKVGIMEMVNKQACKLFGYKKDEMMGKNVKMLMPPPYNSQHDSYLAAYNSTGVGKVMGQSRVLEGRHKEGHLITIHLTLSTVEATGQYMGVIKEMQEDDTVASITVTPPGYIVTVNTAFQSMFGYKATDVQEANITMILSQRSFGNKRPDVFFGELAKAGLEQMVRMEARHMSGTEFTVNVGVEAVLGNYVLKVSSLNDQLGIITINEAGKIQSANKCTLELFGYKEAQLLKMNVSQLMPPPFSRFHDSYLERYVKMGPQGRVVGVPGGRTVMGLHRDGTTFEMNLEVREIMDEEKGIRMFSGRITMLTHANDTRLLEVVLDPTGSNILKVGPGVTDLLGYEPQEIENQPLDSLIDLPQGDKSVGEWLSRALRANAMPSWRLSAKHCFGQMVPVVLELDREERGGQRVIIAKVWMTAALEAIININEEGVITEINMAGELMFGQRSQEVVGSNVKVLMPPRIAHFHDGYLAAYKATGTKKLMGTRRMLEALYRDQRIFAVEVELCEVPRRMRSQMGGAAYQARMVQKPGVPDRDIVEADIQINEEGVDNFLREEEEKKRAEEEAAMAAAAAAERDTMEDLIALDDSPRGSQDSGGGGRDSALAAAPTFEGSGAAMNSELEMAQLRYEQKQKAAQQGAAATRTAAGKEIEPAKGGPASPAPTAGKLAAVVQQDKDREKEKEITDDDRSSSAGDDKSDHDHDDKNSESDAGESSSSGSTVDMGLMVQRARKYKMIIQLLNLPDMHRGMNMLYSGIRAIVLLLLLVHLLVFVGTRINTSSQNEYTDTVDEAGHAALAVQYIALDTRTLESMNTFGGHPAHDEAVWEDHLMKLSDELVSNVKKVFLGNGKLEAPGDKAIEDLFSLPTISIKRFDDTDPPNTFTEEMGLWDAARRFAEGGRKIAQPQMRGHESTHPGWRLIADNTETPLVEEMELCLALERDRSVNNVLKVRNISVIVFAAEIGIAFLLAILFLVRLLQQAAKERVRLYGLFALLPRGVVRIMATQPIDLDVEDSDNELSDNEWEKGSTKDDAGSDKKGAADMDDDHGDDKNRKLNAVLVLNPKGSQLWRILYPLLAYGVLLLVGFALSFVLLGMPEKPANNLVYAWKLAMEAKKVAHLSNELVLASTRRYTYGDAYIRQHLTVAVRDMKRYHDGLLFGDAELNLEGNARNNKALSKLLFDGPQCFRPNRTLCYPPSHPYYAETNNGLDVLVNAYLKRATLLLNDGRDGLSIENERFRFIWEVNPQDIEFGIAKSIAIYLDDSHWAYRVDQLAQIILFVATFVGAWFFYFHILKPFFRATHYETKHVAELLSLLPKSVSVPKLVNQAIGRRTVNSSGQKVERM